MNENVEGQGGILCSKCGTEVRPGRAYCGKCGNKVSASCSECGTALGEQDAFCTVCGNKAGKRDNVCPSCQTSIKYRNQTFCTQCGMLLIVQCASCGAPISEGWAYCAHCGRELNSDRVDIRTANRVKERMANVSDTVSDRGTNAEACNNRGLEYFQNEEYTSAIEEFRSAIRMDSENASYHCNLAVALDEDDQDEEALREYELTLDLQPNDTTALLSLGYMYNENEEYAKAEEVWRRLVSVAPNTAESKEALDNLKHLSEI